MTRFGLAAVFVLAAGAATAQSAMSVDETAMRIAPSAHAWVLQELLVRAQVDRRGDCWCGVSWREINGFVRVEAVSQDDHQQW